MEYIWLFPFRVKVTNKTMISDHSSCGEILKFYDTVQNILDLIIRYDDSENFSIMIMDTILLRELNGNISKKIIMPNAYDINIQFFFQ